MFKFLDGYKTYLTAIATFAIAGLGAIGHPAPDWVLTMLIAFGIYAGRDAIQKLEKK